MTRSLAVLAAVLVLLASCTSADTEPAAVTSAPAPPASASAYTIEAIDLGADDRHRLVSPLPVGLRSEVIVSFGALDDSIDVVLEAELVRSGADGDGQLIELVVVRVEADDAATVEGLLPIVGASSRLVRDERRAIVEQELDVPAGLALRADAIVRQALRAPFALAGPVVTDPVGDGASWVITREDADSTTVEVVASAANEHVLRFELADGQVEITGQPDQLLPAEQVIALDDATLRVTAVPSSP